MLSTLVKPFNAFHIVINTIEIENICIPEPDMYIMTAVVKSAFPGAMAVSHALLCFMDRSSNDFLLASLVCSKETWLLLRRFLIGWLGM